MREDLTNKRFNKLIVISYYGIKYGTTYWNCRCDCGKTTIAQSSKLKSGKIKSCGCYNNMLRKQFAKNHHIHTKYNSPKGFAEHPISNSYYNMISRCYNKKNLNYRLYGERGIKVCEEWLNDASAFFEWSLNNGWKPGLSIDRINVDGNYEPSNCRWSDDKTQSNNRRTNIFLTFNNQTKTITQWAETLGINKRTLNNRINRGWDIQRALTTPVITKGGN